MKPNLLLLSGNYPPETGGPAKFVKNFSDWVSSEISSVCVISTHPDKDLSEMRGNVTVELISRSQNLFMRYIKTIKKIGSHSNRQTLILANGCFFETFIASYIYRISYCVKLPGDIVWEHAKMNKITSLGMMDFQQSKLPLKYSILRFLFSLSLKRSELVIVPSSNMLTVCQGWGIDSDKIKLIYNAVNINEFKPQLDAQKKFDIITVSRLIAIKRIDELIKSAAALNMTLLIVGDGPLMDELVLENLRHGSPATFHGAATQKELPYLYNQARYFVLNSEFEAGTPYALLEARACGLVVLANGATGAADVVSDHVDGFLLNGGLKYDLQGGITEAVNLGVKYQEYSSAAVADCAKRFSEEAIYRNILNSITHHD